MKKTLILVLVLSFFFVALLRGEEKTATRGGRYQLFQGTYTIVNYKENTATEHKTVFRIDTETGKTDYFVASVFKDGVAPEGWRETRGWEENLQVQYEVNALTEKSKKTNTAADPRGAK